MATDSNIKEKLHDVDSAPEPTSFRLIITLAVAGLLAGILISGVNLYTRPMIQANKAEALKKAIFQVLPGCTDYRSLKFEANILIEPEQDPSEFNQDIPSTIFAGYNNSGFLVGIALVAEEPGFQDVITGIFGYDPTAKIIVGFEVLESKETPGLGDKIIKDPGFNENFIALATEPEIYGVKPGQKNNPNEVEMITGATISSKAVVRLLNKGLTEKKSAMEAFIMQKKNQTQ